MGASYLRHQTMRLDPRCRIPVTLMDPCRASISRQFLGDPYPIEHRHPSLDTGSEGTDLPSMIIACQNALKVMSSSQ